MTLIDGLCVLILGFVLGVFCAFFLLGWLEGTFDRYAGIPWSRTLDTCVNFYGKGT